MSQQANQIQEVVLYPKRGNGAKMWRSTQSEGWRILPQHPSIAAAGKPNAGPPKYWILSKNGSLARRGDRVIEGKTVEDVVAEARTHLGIAFVLDESHEWHERTIVELVPADDAITRYYVWDANEERSWGPFDTSDEADVFLQSDKYLESWGSIHTKPFPEGDHYPPKAYHGSWPKEAK